MVKLQTSLLFVTLATVTGSALASSNGNRYLRRELNTQLRRRDNLRFGLATAPADRREFVDDEEDVFIRDFDVLDVRAPPGAFGALKMFGSKAAKSKEGEKVEHVAGQDAGHAEEHVAAEVKKGKWETFKAGIMGNKLNTAYTGLTLASLFSGGSSKPATSTPPSQSGSAAARRSLEEDDDLVRRDFDAEELFGREYDLLDLD